MLNYDIIIIGAGPSGIFCAYELLEHKKDLKVLMIEKGRRIENRQCPKRKTKVCVGCQPCSITTGFAGAGAFSDGKLSLSPDVGGNLPEILGYEAAKELIHESDEIYLKFGADTSIYGVDKEKEIREIRRRTSPELELETFCHGAMCVSYSGRCLLSNYMAGRDANRGQCAQPCRWKYYLSEETRPGQLYEIGENENGSYILNANDMCTAPFLDLICKAGVDSLKIEGRAKTFYYVASVTAAYRRALDAYLADPLNDNFELPAEVYEELTRTSHRHYSPGFYFGREQARQATDSATYIREWEFVGTVDGWENGVASCQQRGKWSLGDTLEALCPDGRSIPLNPEWIENEAGERVESTPHAMEKYTIPTPELPPMSLLRRKTV